MSVSAVVPEKDRHVTMAMTTMMAVMMMMMMTVVLVMMMTLLFWWRSRLQLQDSSFLN